MSFSGCASVPTGLPRVQTPVVALSPGAPTVHPAAVCMSLESTTISPRAATDWNGAEGAAEGRVVAAPPLVLAVMYQSTVEPQTTGGREAVKVSPAPWVMGTLVKPAPMS